MRYIVSTTASLCGQPTKDLNKYLTSSIKFERVSMEEGQLYRYLIPSGTERPIIGEAKNDSIYSALGTKRTYGLVVPMSIEETDVYIFSSDGKQTHKEIVDAAMGRTLPIKEIGTHEKYKYIVEIAGTDVALSFENVIFVPKATEGVRSGVVEVDGMVGFIEDSYHYMNQRLVRVGDLFSNARIYVFESFCKKSDEFHRVVMSSSCANELNSSGIDCFPSTSNTTAFGFSTKTGKFGNRYLIKTGTNNSPASLFFVKDIEPIKELFEDRFILDKDSSVLYLNPKYNKVVFDVEPKKSPSRRGGRGLYASVASDGLRQSIDEINRRARDAQARERERMRNATTIGTDGGSFEAIGTDGGVRFRSNS